MSLRKLQHVIDNLREPSDLRGLTDQLAYILEVYNATSTHPAYREDIHRILLDSAKLARTLCDDSYSTSKAIIDATQLVRVIMSIIVKLEHRPEAHAYGVFNLDTGVLRRSTFNTRSEAEASARESGGNLKIVPVSVITDLSFRPYDPGPSIPEFQAAALEADEAFLSEVVNADGLHNVQQEGIHSSATS